MGLGRILGLMRRMMWGMRIWIRGVMGMGMGMGMGMITIETRDCSWERDLAKQDKIMEAS